jgi:hypothetical protein
MNKQYKRFYFLHIPKTGGRALRENVLYQIHKDLNNTNISYLPYEASFRENTKNYEAHNGWIDQIDDATYVITFVRDPIKQSVSMFSHIYDTQKKNIEKGGVKTKETDFSLLSKQDYLDWVIKDKVMHNLHFKNLLSGNINEDLPNLDPEANMGKGYERLKQINLILDPDKLTNEVMEKIYNRICKDLEITPSELDFVNTESFRNNTSDYIYNQLSDDEKGILRRILYLDYMIYDNKSLFTIL